MHSELLSTVCVASSPLLLLCSGCQTQERLCVFISKWLHLTVYRIPALSVMGSLHQTRPGQDDLMQHRFLSCSLCLHHRGQRAALLLTLLRDQAGGGSTSGKGPHSLA